MDAKHDAFDLEVIHVLDDDKFIDITIDLFESVIPTKSKYFVIKYKDEPLKYVKSKLAQQIKLIDKASKDEFFNLLKNSNNKTIFFHALSSYKVDLAISLPKTFLKVWFVWGYDLYPNLYDFKNIYFEEGTKKFLSKDREERTLKQAIFYNKLTFWLFKNKKIVKKFPFTKKLNRVLENTYTSKFDEAMRKIDVFVPVIPNERDVIHKLNLDFVYAPFTYGFIEHFLKNKLDDNVMGQRNVLLGNSGDPTNNHVDAFKKIRRYNLGKRKVYVPLNYGGTEAYIEFVLQKGKQYLGDNFAPILDFMPLEAYNKIIETCGFVIFNHIRQQGIGNIISSGYLGAKIFLNGKSPAYTYYKSLGVNIYSVDEIDENSIDKSLTEAEFQKNKNLFIETYSQKAVNKKVSKLIEIVIEQQKDINA